MMRPYLIGEAPGKGFDDMPAFSSRSGVFMAKLLGLSGVEELQDVFRCTNLLERWPGASGKGAAFPMVQAKLKALKFARHALPDCYMILAGKRVGEAFKVVPHLQWCQTTTLYWGTFLKLDDDRDMIGMSMIPHPSGVNLLWSQLEIKSAARAHLMSLTDHA